MMPVQTHKNPKNPDRTSTAPYNFVRLPVKILQPPQDQENELDQSTYSGLSGYFDVTIKTSSPLYIRGMMTPERFKELGKKMNLTPEEKIELAEFFSVAGRLHLPGSSLRGMFRSLIEILSFSKLYEITDQHFMYRSVDATRHGTIYRHRLFDEPQKNQLIPRYEAGYMHKVGGTWYIRPAQKINGASFARVSHQKLKDASIQWIQTDPRSRNPTNPVQLVHFFEVFIKPGDLIMQNMLGGFVQIQFIRVEKISLAQNPTENINQRATLVVTGQMNSKKSEAVVFPADPTLNQPSQWIKISEKLVANYRDSSIPEFRKVKLAGPDGVLHEGHPVFYLVDQQEGQQKRLISFGHSPMMRIPYLNSARSLLPESIRKTVWLDLAERIFGYVKENEKGETEARAGRVFFEDAKRVGGPEQPYMNNGRALAPLILSNPKPTTFQHYLVQTDPDQKDNLLDYDDQTLPRGHKLYWARGENPAYQETNNEKLQNYHRQYTWIKPVSKENAFCFRLRFDNLTLIELGALVWVIHLGQDPKLRLRLGMAKPYGLGAIAFTEVKTKLIDRKKRYQCLFKDSLSWSDGGESPEDIEQQLLKAKNTFEEWILADQEINPDHQKTQLEEISRIKELLRLLSWPGPDPANTAYLLNPQDFTPRRVLPGPLAIPLPVQTVTAEVVDIKKDTETDHLQALCEIQGANEEYGWIDKTRYASYTLRVGEAYVCEVSGQRARNGDLILKPLRKVS